MDALEFIKNVPVKPREEMLQLTINQVIKDPDSKDDKVAENKNSVDLNKPNSSRETIKKEETLQCDICCEDVAVSNLKKPLTCNHSFCNECYIHYLTEKIDTNQVNNQTNIEINNLLVAPRSYLSVPWMSSTLDR